MSLIDGYDRDGRRLRVRDTLPGLRPCKLCGSDAPIFGLCDFSQPCVTAAVPRRPFSGIALYYRRCQSCGLLFTEAFDDWTPEDFRAFIYNEAYREVDPDYAMARPKNAAHVVAKAFAAARGELRVLDYGGGAGVFAEQMGEAGFGDVKTYDPFNESFASAPQGRFDLITCFEILEHMPDPIAGATAIVERLADDGMILFGTKVQPQNIADLGMDWWYIGPRNGHVTLFTYPALAALWRRVGLTFITFNDNLHAAYRGTPQFAEHLMPRPR